VGPSWKEAASVLQVHGLQPSGRIRDVEALEVAGTRSTPPPGGSLSSPPRQVRSARVRPPNLFWVRRELVLSKSFQACDCFPARRERLPTPKRVSFSKDL
jgi:hypothetical protein